MSLAAFLSVVLIHLAAAISPGPSFVVALRVAAAEGFRVACALATHAASLIARSYSANFASGSDRVSFVNCSTASSSGLP